MLWLYTLRVHQEFKIRIQNYNYNKCLITLFFEKKTLFKKYQNPKFFNFFFFKNARYEPILSLPNHFEIYVHTMRINPNQSEKSFQSM